jgi:hypothetical protein
MNAVRSIQTASTAYRIGQALMLVNALAGIVDLSTPLPPRKPTSRDQTLATSLRVISEELQRALSDLDREVRRTA